MVNSQELFYFKEKDIPYMGLELASTISRYKKLVFDYAHGISYTQAVDYCSGKLPNLMNLSYQFLSGK